MGIDEYGIVRTIGSDAKKFEADFISQQFDNDAPPLESAELPDIQEIQFQANSVASVDRWLSLGDAIALWRGADHIDGAITAYKSALKHEDHHADVMFRLGVCYRIRHESTSSQAGDFQEAVNMWVQALKRNPNQYIWRRRIQQYGPRLDKPYPFYDWVKKAIEEIKGRGETPVALSVSPTGAEIADPGSRFIAAPVVDEADPEGRIHRDDTRLISTEITVIPSVVRPGETARVHISFRPRSGSTAHWNNEAGPLRLWMNPPPDWEISERSVSSKMPLMPESVETRTVDFELRVPHSATVDGRATGYVLYYVCEDAGGTCHYLRQDVVVDLRVRKVH